MVFRDCQVEATRDVLALLRPPAGRVMLSACVGFGKTKVSLAVAAQLEREGLISHALFVTPSILICEQFAVNADCTCSIAGDRVDLPLMFERSARYGGGEVESLVSYLLLDRPVSTFVGTFDVLRRLHSGGGAALRARAGQLLLVIDEAQYTGADTPEDREALNQITAAKDFCVSIGARILRMSGSTRRASLEEPVLQESEPIVSWTLVQQMLAGYTPDDMSCVVRTLKDTEAIQDVDAGVPDLSDPDVQTKVADLLVSELIADGWPRALVRIKSFRKPEDHRAFLACIRERLVSAGIDRRVVSLYGNSAAAERALQECVDWEDSDRRHSYDDLSEVYLTFRRGEEGADFPSRSHLYLVGCPQSVVKQEQLFGRVLRSRVRADGQPIYPGYPERWLRNSKVVFIVADALSEQAVSRAIFLATSHIATLRAPLGLRAVVRDGLHTARPEASLDLARIEIATPILKKVDACMRWLRAYLEKTDAQTPAQCLNGTYQTARVLGDILTWCRAPGAPLVIDEIVEIVDPQLACETTVEQVRVAIVQLVGGSSAAARKKISDVLAETLLARPEDSIEDVIDAAFLSAYEAFLEESYDPASGSYKIDAEVIMAVAEHVGSTESLVPKTVEEILAVVDDFVRVNGRYPALRDRDTRGVLFGQYDACLKRGAQARFGYVGLAALLVARRGRGDWFTATHEFASAMSDLERRSLTDACATVFDFRIAGGMVPEVLYYPRAFEVVYRYGALLRDWSPQDAERLGVLRRRSQAIVDAAACAGVEALRALLENI